MLVVIVFQPDTAVKLLDEREFFPFQSVDIKKLTLVPAAAASK